MGSQASHIIFYEIFIHLGITNTGFAKCVKCVSDSPCEDKYFFLGFAL